MNMFWELLEAVNRFSGIKFWSSEWNTENTMLSHLKCIEKSDYFKENICWSLSLHHRKKLNIFTSQLLIYYIQYENRKSRLEQMPEAAAWGVPRKRVFFKMSQTPAPESISASFANFWRTPLLQNNSRRLLLKCGHFNNEARDIDCICCRELDALLYCFG